MAEGAGLEWTEEVSYLSKFFIKIWGIDERSLSELLIKHVIVPQDEVRAKELLHLHSHIHGHGNDVVEQNHEGEEICECPD